MINKQAIVYDTFIDLMREKIPQRGKLTKELVDILCIEKEAVYRRLRGEVPFTFWEVTMIAQKLNISLDHIIATNSPQSRPFQLKLSRFYDLTETDYSMHEEFLNLLGQVDANRYSEFGFVTSILPLHFSIRYTAIHRFYVLRWLYQFGNPGAVPVYSQIEFSDRMKGIQQRFLKEVEKVKYTYFIWDKLTLLYLVNDINYFYSIRLLMKEDVELLKEDILNLLTYLENLTVTGSYANGNKVHFYISNLNFETTYTYLQNCDYSLTLIKVFTLNEVASLDEAVFQKVKTWIQSLKRTSMLISESDEKNRILFFESQRKLIEENLKID